MAKQYDSIKHYGRVSETPCFRGKNHKESPRIVNYYGDCELIPCSIFNTAGSLGFFGEGHLAGFAAGILRDFSGPHKIRLNSFGGKILEHFLRAPRCGSGPNCRLEGTPHPQGNWRTFSPARALPPPHPTPLALFARKSYSKVTFGLPAKVTQKSLKSDSKVTFWTVFVTFESLLSNF